MPKYSVIIPAYNSGKFLDDTLDSLINQTVNKSLFEVIVVDDGSIDNTEYVCKAKVAVCSNIKYFKKENGGTSRARNYGLEKAVGKYIVFLDSDDWFEYDFFEELEKYVKDDDYYLHGYFCNYSDKEIKVCMPSFFSTSNHNNIASDILEFDAHGFFSAVCIGVYKRDIIEKYSIRFPENLRFGEDPSFTYQYILRIQSVKYINKELYHYNKCNEGSLTSNYIVNRYPLCKERFKYRKKVYNLYSYENPIKFETQYAKFVSIEMLNCVLNYCKCESEMSIKVVVEKIYEMLNDIEIKNEFCKNYDDYKLSFIDSFLLRYIKFSMDYHCNCFIWLLVISLRIKNKITFLCS